MERRTRGKMGARYPSPSKKRAGPKSRPALTNHQPPTTNHLPFELIRQAREPSGHDRGDLAERIAYAVVHRADRVVVEHVEHVELERVYLVAVPEVLLEVHVELIPALAIERSRRREDDRLRLRLSSREE